MIELLREIMQYRMRGTVEPLGGEKLVFALVLH